MKNFIILTIIALIFFVYLVSTQYYKIHLMYNSSILSLYTPDSFEITNEKQYYTNVRRGFVEMKNSRVVICGLLRDREERISSLKKRVRELAKHFLDYRVLIVENDSKDNTRKKLLEWSKKNSKIIILGCGINKTKCNLSLPKTIDHDIDKKRIEKMAMLRNIYLDFIKKHLFDYDYTIVWDMDILGSVYLDGIANTFGLFSNSFGGSIDMICANGFYRFGVWTLYYDTYAHRDLNETFHLSNKNIFDIKKRLFDINYIRGDPPVKVESCFSGFAVYRTSSLLHPQIRYGVKVTNDGHIECEHVVLHSHLRNKYLNPSMIYLILRNE